MTCNVPLAAAVCLIDHSVAKDRKKERCLIWRTAARFQKTLGVVGLIS